MENRQLTESDILIETHVDLQRQGPGSTETTVQALRFIGGLDQIRQVADFGCGTGAQTMDIARHIAGSVAGVDRSPDFIDVLNRNAEKLGLRDRVKGTVGSMDDLPFPKEAFDLIWSEGAIDNIGFEKGLRYWHGFLKQGGHVAVTCPSWFTAERPAEVERFWADAGSGLDAVEDNIRAMQKAGYGFVAAFTLPETCWTDNYFAPRTAKEKTMLQKYAGSKIMEASAECSEYEAALYAKYKQHYGYAFYIGKKL